MFWKVKTAKEDFTEDMLPHTRPQVFKDVFKLQWPKLLLCGLLSLLFALPLLCSAIFKDLYIMSAYYILEGDELISQLQYIKYLFAALDIIFSIIYFIGFAGLSRIIRKYAFEEPVTVMTDFAIGVKQNIGQCLLLGLVYGILSFAARFFSAAAISVEGAGVSWNLGAIPGVLFLVILGPIGAYMAVTQSVYSVKFTKHVKYGTILYGKHIIKTLLACICCGAVFILEAFPMINGSVFYVHIVGEVVCPFVVPIIMLGFWCFTYDKLDEAINRDYYPELVRKGLAPIKEDDGVDGEATAAKSKAKKPKTQNPGGKIRYRRAKGAKPGAATPAAAPVPVEDSGPAEAKAGLSEADDGPAETNAGPVEEAAPAETNAGPVEEAGSADTNIGPAETAAKSEEGGVGPQKETVHMDAKSAPAERLDSIVIGAVADKAA